MARYQLLLPKMGESVAEATIIKWNKNTGDYIEADEAVMEIATDKCEDAANVIESIIIKYA